jgi:hypothetical protein
MFHLLKLINKITQIENKYIPQHTHFALFIYLNIIEDKTKKKAKGLLFYKKLQFCI